MSHAARVSPAAPRPAHIPESAVYDFDMFLDPAYLADPHKRILELLGPGPPVLWTPRNGGHWMFLSHGANFKASRDTESFTSPSVTPHQLPPIRPNLPPGPPPLPPPLPPHPAPPD